MLSPIEKRFIRYWQEQRTGGRWIYYILYILVGTFISTLILSVFLFLFFQVVFGSWPFIIVLAGGFIFICCVTIATWHINERKFKNIIRREVEEGKVSDKEST